MKFLLFYSFILMVLRYNKYFLKIENPYGKTKTSKKGLSSQRYPLFSIYSAPPPTKHPVCTQRKTHGLAKKCLIKYFTFTLYVYNQLIKCLPN